MIPITTAVAIVVGALMVLTVVVTLSTGSFLAALVVIALLALFSGVLIHYNFLEVKVKGNQVDVFFLSGSPEPTPAAPTPEIARPIQGKEVYHVSDNNFIYDEAAAVCAAYGGELATQEQVEEAYNRGAEWCGYGWSAGGVALYPTQKGTWEQLQKEIDPNRRTACGRPGVNGGYFDPTLKFGVNCYGIKPKGTAILPAPPPGTDTAAFDARVAEFKKKLGSFLLSPFNRTTWSGSFDVGAYGSQFQQALGGLGSATGAGSTPQPPEVNKGSSNAAAPAQSSYKFVAVQN